MNERRGTFRIGLGDEDRIPTNENSPNSLTFFGWRLIRLCLKREELEQDPDIAYHQERQRLINRGLFSTFRDFCELGTDSLKLAKNILDDKNIGQKRELLRQMQGEGKSFEEIMKLFIS